jgi:hypothetical protein
VNTRQKLVVALGVALLVLNFLFPYTSYPVKEPSQDGRSVRITVRSGFRPLWEALREHERATLKGNPFDDTMIQWPTVLGLAGGIVLVCGWCVNLLRSRGGTPSPGEPSQGRGTA